MELPTIGANCGFTACQSLSFLPFRCSFCHKEHCSVHRLPQDHDCTSWSMESQANSVQLCSKCDQMVLVPKGTDAAVIISEHQERNCSIHLLPPVQSIAVPCARKGCRRRDRVVQTCPGCSETFCLGHRHQIDHDCTALERQRQDADAERKRKEDMRAAIAEKFTGSSSGSGSGTGVKIGATSRGEEDSAKEKAAQAKAKTEAAKVAIAEARARVAARSGPGSATATSASASATSASTSAVTKPAPPSVKKASRVVIVMKLKKTAQGEDKIPISSRIYVLIRSPTFPQLDDKAVYLDKTWTVGRALDKIVEWLKVVVPKNEPFDAQMRFSIFHAKELGSTPTMLNMQDRLQQATQVESGDVFYLAPANWVWSTES